jgi:hypothetical protein
MSFKKRRLHDVTRAPEGHFEHASGYHDLAGLLGEHTLDAKQEADAVAPKGYRARSVAKEAKPRS